MSAAVAEQLARPPRLEALPDWLAWAGSVGAYLDLCAAAAEQLNRHYHPTAEGAVKMIPHGSDPAAAKLIRQAFAELARGPQ